METIAERLDGAWLSKERILATGDLSIQDAYAVQSAVIARRLARGERIVGLKMGLTSRAKMQQMGVDTPIYGVLTSAMQLGDGATVPTGSMVAPRVEPEIAFVMARDLKGPVTPVQALQAVAGACGALEIIDSRYRDFKFSLPDVVADNASSAYFVLGSELAPPQNLESRGMIMELNGRIVQTGCSAAIFEHPARALAELANMLATRGQHIEAGQIVLAGAATAAVGVKPGDRVRARIDGLGTISCRMEEPCRPST